MFLQYCFLAKSYIVSVIAQFKMALRVIEFLFFPAYCTSCHDLLYERKALCCGCTGIIKPLVSVKLIITQKYQMEVYAVGAYQDSLRQLVLAKSYQDRLACYYMAQLIYEHLMCNQLTADYLVPIPLHWTRYAKRGYNQSDEIAYNLSRMTGIPLLYALNRVKRTPFQMQFDKEGRKSNVEDAFKVILSQEQIELMKYKRLLFVDDVMTTGSTLHAAARELLPLKPLSLKAVVLARTA
jgi:ComF family protein